ncbi:CRTAC1 family protein [Euzebya rosea]|uniref:CRTAC1 family protein n=1 Tax=Euzebya rosea TaxID=2052804 RepID=UPI000D3ED8C9|nr:CRTAC1 family protein [Euzebya rosea]
MTLHRLTLAGLALVLCTTACTGTDTGADSVEGAVEGMSATTDTPVATGAASPVEPPTAALVDGPDRTHEGPVRLRFTDITEPAGVGLLHESPLDDKDDGRRFMGGAAAADLDNDGFTDLFVLGGGNRPDALYRNNGDGTFTDVAAEAGVDAPHIGAGATMADYDGDGWVDIYVTSHGPPDARGPGAHRLWHNEGDGTFTNRASEADVAWTTSVNADGFGAAFSDYDLDGDLDLFVAGWRRDTDSNRLFRNEGDGTFTDVTEDLGINNEGVRGFGPCWTDLDGDRDPDLLLVADFGTTQVYRNDGADGFVEVRDEMGIGLNDAQAMGTFVADLTGDGLLDWYVTAIHDDDDVGRGLGNMLFVAQPDGTFLEQGASLGVDDGGWGWGAVDVDLDHDGRLDIVETNGWSLPSYEDEPSKVFMNRGEVFEEVALDVGLDHVVDGLSVVRLDVENDGDQDIALTAANDRFALFRNDLDGAGTAWLRIFLDTSDDPALAPHGFGSRIVVEAGGQRQVRHLDGCANYLSSNELSVHVGLGGAETIDRVTVEWADGTTTEATDLGVNQTVTLRPDGS